MEQKKSKKSNKTVCAVAICASPKNSSIVYHRFPLQQDLIKKWAVACKRDDSHFNPRTASVCSEHFLPSDNERDLHNELLGKDQFCFKVMISGS